MSSDDRYAAPLLLIEENAMVRESLQALLAERFNIHAAVTCAAALAQMYTRRVQGLSPFAVILVGLDAKEGIDGFQCLRWLRTCIGYEADAVPAVGYSVLFDRDVRRRSAEAGFVIVLPKVSMSAVLEAELEALLSEVACEAPVSLHM